jgi:hypothetical protein
MNFKPIPIRCFRVDAAASQAVVDVDSNSDILQVKQQSRVDELDVVPGMCVRVVAAASQAVVEVYGDSNILQGKQ